jgi:high-affinity Fe2+/Pb2+ permease
MSTYSPEPGVPQTGTKAYVATGLSFAAAFLAYWIADKDPFTAKEIGEGVLTAAIAGGIVGGGTFTVKNRRK